MKAGAILVILMMMMTACSGGRMSVDPSDLRMQEKKLKEGNYTVQLTWARPLVTNELTQIYNSNMLPVISQSGRVNILDSANFIQKKGDSISLYLPYFGTRQLSINPSDTNSAIWFSGVPEDYIVKSNHRKNQNIVMFAFDQKSETLNLSMRVYGDKSVQVNLNSSHRTTISYRGELKWKEEAK